MSKNKEILQIVEIMSNEKGVDEEVIFDAIETALATATRKKHHDEINARVKIDRETGDYETFRVWEVVDDDAEIEENEGWYMRLSEAQKRDPHAQVGDIIEEPIESVDFGRIGAQQLRFTKRLHFDAAGIDTVLDQIILHGFGAALGQLQVVVSRTTRIGITLDDDLLGRILLHVVNNQIQAAKGIIVQFGAVGLEQTTEDRRRLF
jgi:hypothetical protein